MSQVKASEVQRKYAMELLAKNPNAVIVLPQVEDDGTITGQSVVETGTKGFGYVQLFSREVTVDFRKGVEFENVREKWCLHRGKADLIAAKYPAGTVLKGRIVTEDMFTPTNAANLEQDLKFMSAEARTMNLPSMGVDGEGEVRPIYQMKYWDPTGNTADTIIPAVNREDILAKTRVAGNGQSDALKAKAAQLQVLKEELAQLQGKATKTRADKNRIAEIEELIEA